MAARPAGARSPRIADLHPTVSWRGPGSARPSGEALRAVAPSGEALRAVAPSGRVLGATGSASRGRTGQDQRWVRSAVSSHWKAGTAGRSGGRPWRSCRSCQLQGGGRVLEGQGPDRCRRRPTRGADPARLVRVVLSRARRGATHEVATTRRSARQHRGNADHRGGSQLTATNPPGWLATGKNGWVRLPRPAARGARPWRDAAGRRALDGQEATCHDAWPHGRQISRPREARSSRLAGSTRPDSANRAL